MPRAGAAPTGTGEHSFERRLGAFPIDGERVEFRVWAPHASEVGVRLGRGTHPLQDAGFGVYEAAVEARPGDDYVFVLDGAELPDPCSRFQPQGIRGPSRIVDSAAFSWTDDGWTGVAADELVLYELHVGTFTPAGTFDAVAPRLAELRALGITAIELMPVATFPGDRNWGYDGVYLFAPHLAYGGPEGLARLVDAAHREGLAVVLDVVYNHVGPGSEALAAFGPYFTERYSTPWGDAVNYDGPYSEPVREWAIQNACMWIRDYHVDALRLDAVHFIHDAGPRPLLAELARRVRGVAGDRRVHLIAESSANDPRLIRPPEAGGFGLDAVWADDFHHALHVLLSGERDGYYVDFGRVVDLAAAFTTPFVYQGQYSTFFERRRGAPADDRPATQFVVYAQNHDQVGNRALGDRLPPERRRLAVFCVLLSPFVPLLFMGEEYGETRPFQFFTDHIDPAIAEATRQGRRREFAAFGGFEGDLPDPQSVATFEASTLDPAGGDDTLRDLYADLLRLRRRLSAVTETEVDEEARWLRLTRSGHEVLCNFSDAEAAVPTRKREIVLATAPPRLARERGEVVLAPWSGTVLQ